MTEKIIIKKLLEDKNYFTTVFGDIKITDFERPEHQAIFKSLGMLYNQYKKQPSVDEINLFVDASTEIKIPLKALMREELNEIRNTPVNISDEILVDMTEKYIKNTRFKAVLMRGVEVLDGSSKKDSIESLSEETNDIRKMTFKKSLGLDYIRDYKSNFVQYGEVEEAGIKAPLDIINVSTGGGFKPGTLTVIASVSNGGKTIFLSNISGFTALQGKNVALFHMEETELEVRERIDAYLLNKETSELKVQGTSLIGPFEHLISKGFGNIKIRSYGPNTASCLHFQAQLDDWKLQDGFIPDIIIADSITIIKPNSNVDGLYGKGKAVSEELKSLGVYNNVPIVSAVQLGRCLDLYTEVIEKTKGRIFIKDIEVGDKVLSEDGYKDVKYKFPVEKTKRYKIKTESGKEIICSEKHIFPTDKGEISIEKGLKAGSYLYIK